jgi:hypothetical protein
MYQPNQLSFTNNSPLQAVGVPIVSASATSGLSLGFGSSLFLDRLYVPGPMNLSEVDMAMSLAMASAASSTGTYGSFARSMAIYSFSNSTKLVSFLSASWSAGFLATTVTVAGSTNYSNIVAGWSQAGGVIVPMTFASTELPPGDYVIANLVSFSGSANASVSIFGQVNPGTATLGALSSGGLSAASAFTSSASGAAGSSNPGILAFGNKVGILSMTALPGISTFSVGVASVMSLQQATSGSISTLAGSYITSAAAAVSLLSTGGLNAGSFLTASGSISAITLATSLPGFNYLGAGSSTNLSPGIFQNGIFSSGGIPAAITLSATVSFTSVGSVVAGQPWYALVGA